MSEELKPETKGAHLFRLPPGFFALALMTKYSILVLYGIHAIVVSVPSFVAVGGELFALTWASVVTTLSIFALLGTIRTWFTGKPKYEKWATAGLVLGFLAYAIVLVVRGIQNDNWDGASWAWIPVALVVLPTFRYYQLVAQKAWENRK